MWTEEKGRFTACARRRGRGMNGNERIGPGIAARKAHQARQRERTSERKEWAAQPEERRTATFAASADLHAAVLAAVAAATCWAHNCVQ